MNYTLVGTRYYRVVDGDVSDADATAECQAEGAELAMFKTEADWKEITDFLGDQDTQQTLLLKQGFSHIVQHAECGEKEKK